MVNNKYLCWFLVRLLLLLPRIVQAANCMISGGITLYPYSTGKGNCIFSSSGTYGACLFDTEFMVGTISGGYITSTWTISSLTLDFQSAYVSSAGRFVLTDTSGYSAYYTNAAGSGAYLLMQDDGDLVLYSSANIAYYACALSSYYYTYDSSTQTYDSGYTGTDVCPVSTSSTSISYCSVTPTAYPTVVPTSRSPTLVPSTSPTVSPTRPPTKPPTNAPSYAPSYTPTVAPTTYSPSYIPTVNPSRQPTVAPTVQPTTSFPTIIPTALPSIIPSYAPSMIPTLMPSKSPTFPPTLIPTASPTTYKPTYDPTLVPTVAPTRCPTIAPSPYPTLFPTQAPSFPPTKGPTVAPSQNPTIVPTQSPTTPMPSVWPTLPPTKFPTMQPTFVPTDSPTTSPTFHPTSVPTSWPTGIPTSFPTLYPTAAPTTQPTGCPTGLPSSWPSTQPTACPTSSSPTSQPTSIPTSSRPTSSPSTQPTSQPTNPTSQPTGQPSSLPTSVPTSYNTSYALRPADISGMVFGLIVCVLFTAIFMYQKKYSEYIRIFFAAIDFITDILFIVQLRREMNWLYDRTVGRGADWIPNPADGGSNPCEGDECTHLRELYDLDYRISSFSIAFLTLACVVNTILILKSNVAFFDYEDMVEGSWTSIKRDAWTKAKTYRQRCIDTIDYVWVVHAPTTPAANTNSEKHLDKDKDSSGKDKEESEPANPIDDVRAAFIFLYPVHVLLAYIISILSVPVMYLVIIAKPLSIISIGVFVNIVIFFACMTNAELAIEYYQHEDTLVLMTISGAICEDIPQMMIQFAYALSSGNMSNLQIASFAFAGWRMLYAMTKKYYELWRKRLQQSKISDVDALGATSATTVEALEAGTEEVHENKPSTTMKDAVMERINAVYHYFENENETNVSVVHPVVHPINVFATEKPMTITDIDDDLPVDHAVVATTKFNKPTAIQGNVKSSQKQELNMVNIDELEEELNIEESIKPAQNKTLNSSNGILRSWSTKMTSSMKAIGDQSRKSKKIEDTAPASSTSSTKGLELPCKPQDVESDVVSGEQPLDNAAVIKIGEKLGDGINKVKTFGRLIR